MTDPALLRAWVLHVRPYRESSLLLEALVAHRGRMGLVARGARRGKSGRGGLLQPFVPLLVSFRGRGELPTLAACERDPETPATLPSARLALGLYLNELLVRLLPRGDAHDRLFSLYGQAIADLQRVPDVEPTLRRFERCLLDELGYGLEWSRDAESGLPVEDEQLYCVEIDRGPVPVARPSGGDRCVAGSTLRALESGRFQGDEQRREARRLMAAIIRHYLGGESPRSRQLMKKGWNRE